METLTSRGHDKFDTEDQIGYTGPALFDITLQCNATMAKFQPVEQP